MRKEFKCYRNDAGIANKMLRQRESYVDVRQPYQTDTDGLVRVGRPLETRLGWEDQWHDGETFRIFLSKRKHAYRLPSKEESS